MFKELNEVLVDKATNDVKKIWQKIMHGKPWMRVCLGTAAIVVVLVPFAEFAAYGIYEWLGCRKDKKQGKDDDKKRIWEIVKTGKPMTKVCLGAVATAVAIIPFAELALFSFYSVGAWAKKDKKSTTVVAAKQICKNEARQKIMEKLAMARNQKCLYEHRIRNRYLDYIKVK